MAGPDSADDLRLMYALRAGGPGALSQVFDTYGPWLYDYAHALLRDRDWAAAALRDALLAVYAQSAALPDPARFRGWLYALVRDECLARLADPATGPAVRREAPDAVAPGNDDPERLEARRQVVHAALSELDGQEREAADLTLRHGLGAVELAEVMGLSARESAELAIRVRGEVAASLTAELGRPVTGDQLPAALRVLPFAQAPDELRAELMSAAAELDEGGRTALLDRPDGFPRSGGAAAGAYPGLADSGQYDERGGTGGGRRRAEHGQERSRLWPALATAGAVVLVVVLVFLALPGSPKSSASGSSPTPTGDSATVSPQADTPSQSTDPSASPTRTSPKPTTSSRTTQSTTQSTAPRTTAPRRTSTHTSTPGGGAGLTSNTGGCGVLDATGGKIASCTFPVTAHGGAVIWWVTGATASKGASASGFGSGSLAKGASASATVTVTPAANCNTAGGGGTATVTFAPGGSASVTYIC